MWAALGSRLASGFARLAVLTRFARREDGATAVEFAMVAAPFFAMLYAILQTALVFFAGQVLETTVADASRLILTGQAQLQNMSEATFAQKLCGMTYALFNCNKFIVDVQKYDSFSSANTSSPTLTFNAQGQVTNSWAYNPGNPGDIVVMRLMYQWPVYLGPLGFNLSNLSNGNRLLMATAAFKNEPY